MTLRMTGDTKCSTEAIRQFKNQFMHQRFTTEA